MTQVSTTYAVDDAPWHEPFVWLKLGWQDFTDNPRPGLLHGGAMAFFGLMLFWWAHDQFWFLVGAMSGFLIVAPLLATSLYAVSKRHHEGGRLACHEVIGVWLTIDKRLIGFGVLLALAGTGWVLSSAGLITAMTPVPVQKPVDFLRVVVAQNGVGLFELWLVMGAFLAAPMFASSVITLPMLVDTRASVYEAVTTSWRVVAANPVAMAVWAMLIAGMTLMGMVLGMLGLVLTVPVLGHASWHAYRRLCRIEG